MGLAISLARISVSRSSSSNFQMDKQATNISLTSLWIYRGRNRAMRFVGFLKKKMAGLVIRKPKSRSLPLLCLASAECLTVPRVQVVELRAEMGCTQCQKRLAHALSKMGGTAESLVFDVLGKKMTITCRVPSTGVSVKEAASTVPSCLKSGKDGRRILLLPPCN